MSNTSFGERLKIARGKIPQAEIKRRYGLGKNTLSNYETGVTSPKLNFIIEFAKDFNIDVNWLLFGVGEPPTTDLDAREAILLDHYRNCDDQGKDAMLRTGAALAQQERKVLKKSG